MTGSHSNGRRFAWAVLAAGGVAAAAAPAAHGAVAYNNTTTETGAYTQGPAAVAVSGTDFTTLVADDITPDPSTVGQPLSSATFSIYNGNATAVTVIANLRFYAADPTTGNPTTYLTGLATAPITVAANGAQLVTTAVPLTGTFLMPADGFYAGLVLSDGTNATVTNAQLANLGQLTYDPPTVGSSDDLFFQTTTPGSYNYSSPVGNFYNFGGSPVANFAWKFTTAAVPEPASMAAVGLATVGVLGRRRRRPAVA